MEKEKLLKRIFYVIIAVLLACAVVLAGVNLFYTVNNNRKESLPAFSTEKLAESVMPSVAEIVCSGLTASAVLVESDSGKNYLITNRHAVLSEAVSVRFYKETDFYKGNLVKYDDYHDIAIIYCERVPLFAKPAVVNYATLKNGEEIFVAGNALGAGVSFYEGLVAKNNRFLEISNIAGRDGKKVVPVYQISAPVNAGASGGGLFNKRGELVGINAYQSVSATENAEVRPVDGISYSVPISIAMSVYNAEIDPKFAEGTMFYKNVALLDIDSIVSGRNFEIQIHGLAIYLKQDNGGFTVSKGGNVPEMSAEVKEGDKITKFGSVTITPNTIHAELFSELYKYKKGNSEQRFTLGIDRDGKTEEIIYASTVLK